MLKKLFYRVLVAVYPILMTILFVFFLMNINNVGIENSHIWILSLAYCFCLYVFFIIYYGNKIGVYRIVEIMYSNALSLLITNVIFGLFLTVLLRCIDWGLYFVLLFVGQLVCSGLWTIVCNSIQMKIYGSHRILLISSDKKSAETLHKKLDAKMWSNLDYIVTISEGCKEKFDKFYPELSDKTIVIENILSENFIVTQSKKYDEKDSFFNSNCIKALSVGRFCKAKNFDNIPDICSRLIKKGLNLKWYIIGYGSDEELIKQKIKQANMESNVIILGKKENPYPYIKNCDLYVQPSRYEGKCVAVREAQILNKPVVITAYGTSESQLKNGYDGVIVPMDNEGCAEGIYNVLTNKELLECLAYNCSQNDYSNSQEIKKLYEIINKGAT